MTRKQPKTNQSVPQKQPRLDKRSLGLHIGSGTVPKEYEPEQFKHRCKGSVYLFSTTTVWQHTGIEKNGKNSSKIKKCNYL